jgi:hypothetical protein
MAVTLPLVPSIPNYRVGTVLDDVQYILDLRWNGRASAWYMDVLAVDESPIKHGIKLVLGSVLGRRVADSRFPQGTLMAADLTGAGQEAGLDDLGVRVAVFYFSPGEV